MTLQEQIEQVLADQIAAGCVESFSNGGHSVTRTKLRELVEVQALLEQRQQTAGGGRLVDFDPRL